MVKKHFHLLPQSFRINLNYTFSNISIDPNVLFSVNFSVNFIRFSHKGVYPTMVVRNIQIYGVQISGIAFAS